jgi:hypothetical protein
MNNSFQVLAEKRPNITLDATAMRARLILEGLPLDVSLVAVAKMRTLEDMETVIRSGVACAGSNCV